ncbi:MAG: nuclear transport factor 2 family protein [Acidimicrobiaceae bacterium]|nr:nuclear transport factor 2 family protein [Acidimicrobiaceae bacterium]
MTTKSSHIVLQSLISSFNNHSHIGLRDFLDQKSTYWDPAVGTLNGLDEIIEHAELAWIKFPTRQIEVSVIIGNESVVVAEIICFDSASRDESTTKLATIVCNVENNMAQIIRNYFDQKI